MDLNELMIRHGTDKQEGIHNYVKFYKEYFEQIRDKKLKILEIGIFRPPLNHPTFRVGASLKTWYDYFPNSKIYGIDLGDFSDIENDRIHTMIANQELRYKNQDFDGLNEVIEKFGSDFDIIIDDGGHTMSQQQISLGFLFKHLSPNGYYIVEDLETSRMAPHAYNKTNTKYSTLFMFENYLNTGKIFSDFMYEDENNYLINNIEKLVINKGNHSEIVFIKKI